MMWPNLDDCWGEMDVLSIESDATSNILGKVTDFLPHGNYRFINFTRGTLNNLLNWRLMHSYSIKYAYWYAFQNLIDVNSLFLPLFGDVKLRPCKDEVLIHQNWQGIYFLRSTMSGNIRARRYLRIQHQKNWPISLMSWWVLWQATTWMWL